MLRLTYSGSSPAETGAVLDALVDAFAEEVREEGQSDSREALRLISEARDQVLRDLEAVVAERREFERTSPLVRGPEGRPLNPHAADLLELDAARDALRLELSNLTAELESIHASLEAGGRRAALAQMASLKQEGRGENPAAAALGFEEENLALILQLEEARETKGDNHPEIRRLENRLAALRRLAEERAGLERAGSEGGGASRPPSSTCTSPPAPSGPGFCNPRSTSRTSATRPPRRRRTASARPNCGSRSCGSARSATRRCTRRWWGG